MPEVVGYTVGGTVQAGGGLYISRQADEELLELCRAGEFAYILSSRQIGKSSLMVRTADRLAAEGIRSVMLDLSQLGTGVTAEQWYLGVLTIVEDQLTLDTDALAWWEQHAELSHSHRLTLFFEKVLLAEVAAPIVTFVDEIDSTLSLPFTDDFYAAIRYLHNARSRIPAFQRVSFVLIGVATPGDLISDPQRTPFNIGHRVDLEDWTYDEALPLADGLELPPVEARQVLQWALRWTGGHPYLTQRLCEAIREEERESWSEAAVEKVVARMFLGEKSGQDSNLLFVRDMLIKRIPSGSSVYDILTTYRKIRQNRRPVPDEERSVVKSHLKLSGIVRREASALRVRNLIYRNVFDDRWIGEHLRFNWQRLLQRAIRTAGLLSVVLVVFTVPLAVYAWQQKGEAETQRAVAQSRELAADALTQLSADPQLSIVLARQAARDSRTVEAQDALRQALLASPLQAVLRGHRGAVNSAVFSPDGTLVVTGGTDGTARTWEARTGRPVHVLRGHTAPVRDAVFSPDGKLVATASDDRTGRVWDVRTRKPLWILRGHADVVTQVVFSPDSKRIVSASPDGTARIWDARKGTQLYVLQNFGSVQAVAFSPDGKLVLTGSADGTARIWQTRTGRFLHALRTTSAVLSAAFSPAGELALTGGADGTAQLWEVHNARLLHTLPGPPFRLNGVAFSPDGKLVVTGGAEGTARIWEVHTGNQRHRLPGHRNPQTKLPYAVSSVAFSPDGKLVATAGDDKARLWNVGTGKKVVLPGQTDLKTGLPNPMSSVAFSSDGSLVVTAGADGLPRVWRTHMANPWQTLRLAGTPTSVAFGSDGKRLVTGSEDGTIRLWDVRTGSALSPLHEQLDVNSGSVPSVTSVAFSPDGALLASGSANDTIHLWNTRGTSSLGELHDHMGIVNSIAFDRDSALLASGSADKVVRLWNPNKGRLVRKLHRGMGAVNSVAFSRDGGLLASGGADGTVRLWDAQNMRLMSTLQSHTAVNSVALSPRGGVLAAGSEDGTVHMWDVRSHDRLALLRGPASAVTSLAFSSDGKLIIAGSRDATAWVWGADTHDLRAILRGHTDAITSVAFSPNGKLIATASKDKTVHLAKCRICTSYDNLLKLADQRVSRTLTPQEQRVYLHQT